MPQGENLLAMYIFARVVEERSFSQAARLLGISTATVSREIAALENRLAMKLLLRTTRKVSITECGLRYYHYCQILSQQVAGADEFIRQMHAQPGGQVRLVAPVTFGCQVIVPLLQPFMQQNIHLHVDLDLSDRTPDMVTEDIDMAIVVRQQMPDENNVRPLSEIHLGLYASEAYLATHPTVEHPDDLNRHQLLTFHGPAHQPTLTFRQDKKRVQINTFSRFRANNSMALLTAACTGAGIACLPTYMVEQALAQNILKPVLASWQLPGYQSYMLLREPQSPLSPVSRLCDLLTEKLQTR